MPIRALLRRRAEARAVARSGSAAYGDEVERPVERPVAELEVLEPDLLRHGVRPLALATQLSVVEALECAPRQESTQPQRIAAEKLVESAPLRRDQGEVALRSE